MTGWKKGLRALASLSIRKRSFVGAGLPGWEEEWNGGSTAKKIQSFPRRL